jgi:hypothetical protein
LNGEYRDVGDISLSSRLPVTAYHSHAPQIICPNNSSTFETISVCYRINIPLPRYARIAAIVAIVARIELN